MTIKHVPMLTNVTNGTIRKKQLISFKRLMLGKSPSLKMLEYVGLDFFNLKQWFAPKMFPQMNWNNYGEVWTIEQLVPLDYFDLLKEEECKIAWNYKNLIPVLVEDIYHIRYSLTFSIAYIKKLEQCPITERLLLIATEEIAKLNDYLPYY